MRFVRWVKGRGGVHVLFSVRWGDYRRSGILPFLRCTASCADASDREKAPLDSSDVLCVATEFAVSSLLADAAGSYASGVSSIVTPIMWLWTLTAGLSTSKRGFLGRLSM